MSKALYMCFVAAIFFSKAMATEKDPYPDVQIVVFRHHPFAVSGEKGISNEERMKACSQDEKVILKAAEDLESKGSKYLGGLGSGYELFIQARDLGRWKDAVDKLIKSGSLKYYVQWGLDKNGFGFVPIR